MQRIVFESSYEPKLILQESILDFRNACFDKEQVDASSVLEMEMR